jgi:hypothetical protein
VAAFAPGAPYGQIGAQSVLKRLRRAEAESSTGRERTGPSPPANQEWPRPCLRPRAWKGNSPSIPPRGRGRYWRIGLARPAFKTQKWQKIRPRFRLRLRTFVAARGSRFNGRSTRSRGRAHFRGFGDHRPLAHA